MISYGHVCWSVEDVQDVANDYSLMALTREEAEEILDRIENKLISHTIEAGNDFIADMILNYSMGLKENNDGFKYL